MGIDSLRAEITWFESARAYAAADGRVEVTIDDLKAVAPMALRLRRSPFMNEYIKGQMGEEKELGSLLGGSGRQNRSNKPPKRAKRVIKIKGTAGDFQVPPIASKRSGWSYVVASLPARRCWLRLSRKASNTSTRGCRGGIANPNLSKNRSRASNDFAA